MEFTKKLSLAKPLISDTFKTWLQAHNDNADAIDERFQKEACYVVEEGDQDLWHYRKWSDGCCEGWCKKDYQFRHEAGWNDYWYKEYTISFPFTFSSNPFVLLTANSLDDLYWVHSRYAKPTYVNFYIFTVKGDDKNNVPTYSWPGSINCYVRGKLA